jgi:hypothetical protein
MGNQDTFFRGTKDTLCVVTGVGLSRLQGAGTITLQALAVLSNAKSTVVQIRLTLSLP